MTVNKIFPGCKEAVADIFDGATVMVGGFGSFGGLPINLLVALAEQGARNLTVIANMGGVGFELSKRIKPEGYQDLGALFERGQIKKFIGSVPALGGMPPTSPIEKLFNEGKVEIETVPQGTLAERITVRRWWPGGILYPGWHRNRYRERQREKGARRPGVPAGAAADGGLRPDQGPPGGYAGESRVPGDGPVLQPGHGHGRQGDDSRGRPYCKGRGARPRGHRHAPCLCQKNRGGAG